MEEMTRGEPLLAQVCQELWNAPIWPKFKIHGFVKDFNIQQGLHRLQGIKMKQIMFVASCKWLESNKSNLEKICSLSTTLSVISLLESTS